jgi:hypothetical protein
MKMMILKERRKNGIIHSLQTRMMIQSFKKNLPGVITYLQVHKS